MAEISSLRRRMIEDMTVRNLSPATQQSYLNAVSKFSRYFGRSPDHLGLEDVHAFPSHIACDSASNSEIVVPLVRNGELLGVLDIDSPKKARFSAEDEAGCVKLADILSRAI